ncbi:hypothetical protein F4054_02600 [Candidatus Poribacteria bacterium]|nr:hypothetical protein [Candidatus Poribacteria bacterium]MYK21134.1 hypothetical protein [Candidatus Poribacteria bacterium]
MCKKRAGYLGNHHLYGLAVQTPSLRGQLFDLAFLQNERQLQVPQFTAQLKVPQPLQPLRGQRS